MQRALDVPASGLENGFRFLQRSQLAAHFVKRGRATLALSRRFGVCLNSQRQRADDQAGGEHHCKREEVLRIGHCKRERR